MPLLCALIIRPFGFFFAFVTAYLEYKLLLHIAETVDGALMAREEKRKDGLHQIYGKAHILPRYPILGHKVIIPRTEKIIGSAGKNEKRQGKKKLRLALDLHDHSDLTPVCLPRGSALLISKHDGIATVANGRKVTNDLQKVLVAVVQLVALLVRFFHVLQGHLVAAIFTDLRLIDDTELKSPDKFIVLEHLHAQAQHIVIQDFGIYAFLLLLARITLEKIVVPIDQVAVIGIGEIFADRIIRKDNA